MSLDRLEVVSLGPGRPHLSPGVEVTVALPGATFRRRMIFRHALERGDGELEVTLTDPRTAAARTVLASAIHRVHRAQTLRPPRTRSAQGHRPGRR